MACKVCWGAEPEPESHGGLHRFLHCSANLQDYRTLLGGSLTIDRLKFRARRREAAPLRGLHVEKAQREFVPNFVPSGRLCELVLVVPERCRECVDTKESQLVQIKLSR